MFDYLDFEAFGPGEIMDFYSTSSPACALEEQDQDLSAFFPELMEADWQQHRCSQCRWNILNQSRVFGESYPSFLNMSGETKQNFESVLVKSDHGFYQQNNFRLVHSVRIYKLYFYIKGQM